ncbi:MAG: hypothetical protein ACREU6_06815 [Steroidobacteraceae bacterium]
MSIETTTNAHFYECQYGIPIAGTPKPLPCPFCGDDECISIVFGHNGSGPMAHVECGHCGAEAGYSGRDEELGLLDHMDCAKNAARLWNTRSLRGD